MSRIRTGSVILLLLLGAVALGAKTPATSDKAAVPAATAPAARPAAKAPAGPWWTAAPDGPLDAVFGAETRVRWELPATGFTVETDPLLGRPALVVSRQGGLSIASRAIYQQFDATCLVRLVTDAQQTTASLGLTLQDPDPAKPASSLTVTGYYQGNLVVSGLGASATYDLRAYDTIMPTWPDAVRAPIERDMTALPLSQDKWVRLRVLLNGTQLRVWVDDRLLVDKTDHAQPRAGLALQLPPSGRLAELRVRALPPPGRYEPVALDGYVRDRALLRGAAVADGALPFGQTVTVAGVPVRFTARATKTAPDHLDVGRSLVRQGAMQGYFPANSPRYAGSWLVDPARLQLRIPNGRYDAMYVVAGFDGGPDRLPQFSALFYRPGAGFAQSFEATVPALTATAAQATPLPVTLENGKKVNLWLVKLPLDPAKLNSFADLDILEVELTKQVAQYRSYPDPYLSGWHGAGRPSGVQIYAVTLHKAPVELALEPTVFGHVWTDPETPGYTVALTNHTAADRTVALAAQTTSDDRGETTQQDQTVVVPAGTTVTQTFAFPVKKHGIHRLDLTLKDGDARWTETRNFCKLHTDTRAPEYVEGHGPQFGYWSYGEGHYSVPPGKGEEARRVMTKAGARAPLHPGNAWPITPQWGWAAEEPIDPAKYEAYKQTAIDAIRARQGDNPDLITFFPEPHLSRDLTAGGAPLDYFGEDYQLTPEEERALRVFYQTSKSAGEAVRKQWPQATLLIPWGDPLFVVPLLRAGFPKELIDGSGLDMIGFERLPEQQIHQQSTHRLYILKQEYEKAGIPDPKLYYVEGIFSPTEPGALTWQEQAERYHRWTLLSLAYGIEKFYSGWFAFDCTSYYGAEHYGGCGIQRRVPYNDPKPAYAHYATMTRMLERSKFDSWLPTGSHTAYCLKFMRLGQPVYAVWTVRGQRPFTLNVANDLTVTDSMDNAAVVKAVDGAATITVGTSPLYLTGAEITGVTLGAPDHADAVAWSRTRNQATWHDGPVVQAPPVQAEKVIARFGDGTWRNAAERDAIYETNNFDTKRYPGKMRVAVTTDPERPGSQLAVHLEPQDTVRMLAPWYTVLKPKAPVAIPGKACALGVWVKAHSDWGRIIYSLRDAKGERWLSCGKKDDWNNNDVHGWSQFNFDGWRYLRFELPSNAPYDTFREFGSTWWGSYHGDGIVDLPLQIEKVIVERRTHVMYVNDPQPADPSDVLLGELVAEYATPFDATPQAVAQSRLRIPVSAAGIALPNPIADMAANPLPAVTLQGIRMPDWGYDGTSCYADYTEAPDATEYQVWVAAYPDGRGAVVLGRGPTSGALVRQLQPAEKLYLWITYKTKGGATSKPSNALPIELVDAFANK